MIGQIADPAANRQLVLHRTIAPHAVDFNIAALRLQDSGHHSQERRLAHSVGADDRH
jgi:hypothetical protein